MQDFKPGDYVKITGQDTTGEVLSVKGNDVEIAFGLMKLVVKKNKLTASEAPEEEEFSEEENDVRVTGIDTREKMMQFKFELDLRGKMKEEVLNELGVWVDDAILLGIREAKIIHGRGTGVIKDTVRSFLRKYKEIDSLKDHEGHGGEGVTVVRFRSE